MERNLREAVARIAYETYPFYECGEQVDGFQVSPGGNLSWEEAKARAAEFGDDPMFKNITAEPYQLADAILLRLTLLPDPASEGLNEAGDALRKQLVLNDVSTACEHAYDALAIQVSALLAERAELVGEVERLKAQVRTASGFDRDAVFANLDAQTAARASAETKLAALEGAVRPFVIEAERVHEAYNDNVWLWQRGERCRLTVGDLRALNAALDRPSPTTEEGND